jgi:hypothetical protein
MLSGSRKNRAMPQMMVKPPQSKKMTPVGCQLDVCTLIFTITTHSRLGSLSVDQRRRIEYLRSYCRLH